MAGLLVLLIAVGLAGLWAWRRQLSRVTAKVLVRHTLALVAGLAAFYGCLLGSFAILLFLFPPTGLRKALSPLAALSLGPCTWLAGRVADYTNRAVATSAFRFTLGAIAGTSLAVFALAFIGSAVDSGHPADGLGALMLCAGGAIALRQTARVGAKYDVAAHRVEEETAMASTEDRRNGPLTVEEIEAAELRPDDGRVPHVPFGFRNDDWQRFKAAITPGDLIYWFESSPASWRALAGRAGYVLVRDGEEIAKIVTTMN